MIYIKLFDNFNNQLYIELELASSDGDKYYFYENDSFEFTEVLSIKNMCITDGRVQVIHTNWGIEIFKLLSTYNDDGTIWLLSDYYQIVKKVDEIYFVSYIQKVNKANNINSVIKNYNKIPQEFTNRKSVYSYYICDQFDGLLEFIKDKILH